MENMKLLVAKLLEDAKRVQQIEPNNGTATRIDEAKAFLSSSPSPESTCEESLKSQGSELLARLASAGVGSHVLDDVADFMDDVWRLFESVTAR